jgi:Domain of unknown function (DUF4131)
VTLVERIPAPHLLVGAFAVGLSASLALRPTSGVIAAVAALLGLLGVAGGRNRAGWLAGALLLAGLWWGGQRLSELDRSVLAREIGSTALARAEVTGPARTSPFTLRVPVRVLSWGGRAVDEAARLMLPRGRAPPQGAVLELVASASEPASATDTDGFDERAYLRRQGVHVVLRADSFRVVGQRGGLGGLADGLRSQIAGTMAPGLEGERRAVLAGVVLGEDEGLAAPLRDSFRASGLYHLLSQFQVSNAWECPAAGHSDKPPEPDRGRRHGGTIRPVDDVCVVKSSGREPQARSDPQTS